jgi:mannose-1-phosphate guanylyltransferase
MPELYSDTHHAAINDFYHASESVSIDYGIMESADSVFVVPGEFGWNDVGSWSAVFELAEKDANGNAIQTVYAAFAGATSNLVFSESDKMIALVGVENLAVVETDSAILVCDLSQAQGVKQIVDFLKANEDLNSFL